MLHSQVNQHSYYKRAAGAYAVGVEVYLSDLDLHRQSEKDLAPNLLSAGSGEFFWLKKGTIIRALDIKDIEMAVYCRLNAKNLIIFEKATHTVAPGLEQQATPLTPSNGIFISEARKKRVASPAISTAAPSAVSSIQQVIALAFRSSAGQAGFEEGVRKIRERHTQDNKTVISDLKKLLVAEKK